MDTFHAEYTHIPYLIDIDKNNNIYMGGIFAPLLGFGNTTLYCDTSTSFYDWYLAKYKNVACNCNLLQPAFTITQTGVNSFNFVYNGDMPYANIQWSFGDGNSASNIPSASHAYPTNGTYPVCVTVTNGCGQNTACQYVNITTAANDPEMVNVNIYPNPAEDELKIINAPEGASVEIYNLMGSRIIQTTVNGGDDHIDLRRLSSGVYLLLLRDREGRQTSQQFIKK